MTTVYPYIPDNRTIQYVPISSPFMQAARDYAKTHSLDPTHPTGSVLVKEGEIIGYGANGSTYHEEYGCERKRQGIPTGEGYDLCEGCHPKNHSEPKAITDAKNKGNDTEGADLYLWGHWWCCEPCWNAMIAAGVRDVYLLEDSKEQFDNVRK